MPAKSKKTKATKADAVVVVEKKEGYGLVRPDHIYVSKAVNGYTVDPELDGGAVWVAKDEKELAELVARLFTGIPAKQLQPELEEITEEE